MNMRDFLYETFTSDVESLIDFEKRIEDIKKEFSKPAHWEDKNMNFAFFYRGDRFCMQTQCHLFRKRLIKEEAALFGEWQNSCNLKSIGECDGENCGDFMCLTRMQHYNSNTRLLDFTEDPRVALRFACGREGENCRKKVTVYCAQQIDFTKDDNTAKYGKAFMSLVKSNKPPLEHEEILSQDWFVKVDKSFGRIKRQEGLFMFMGNHKHPDINHRYIKDKKIPHELSETTGRGKIYPGFTGVLKISPNAIESIRAELENNNKYKMNYLMDINKEGL